jgi:L-rhamnose mutarotase
MKKYCLAVDLVDDPKMIEEYEGYHKQIRPEIEKSIKDAGITQMEIYRLGDRLFMNVHEWEQLMWKYQKALPSAKPGEKWVLMNKIFALKE